MSEMWKEANRGNMEKSCGEAFKSNKASSTGDPHLTNEQSHYQVTARRKKNHTL